MKFQSVIDGILHRAWRTARLGLGGDGKWAGRDWTLQVGGGWG